MPDYDYIARDQGGQQVAGRISAATQREAVALLDKRALFPVKVDAARAARRVGRVRRIRGETMAVTYSQLAGLLRSGVPLLRSLLVLREQTSNEALGDVLEKVRSEVEEGTPLAEAMSAHPGAFGEMAVSMVRAGSEGGFLEDALQRVAEFTEQQEDLKGRVVGALAYPVLLAGMATVIVTLMMIFIVPQFESLFAQLRQRGELPWATDALLALSRLLSSWGLAIAALVVAAGFWARGKLRTDAGRLWRDRWKLRLPLAGTIVQNLSVARFCRVLGTLLHNGVPILKSLDISGQATGNRVLAGAVNDAAENISAGESLAGPLKACEYFPRNVTEMVAVAEESNTLDTVLTEIADSLERHTWRRLDLLVRLLEPVMLLILAGVVLLIVVALLMPVMKMSSMIKA